MKTILLLPAVLALAACTVGPDYHGPPPSAPDAVARGTFVRADPDAVGIGPTVARWWETLGDPTLTQLVDDALARSPSIDVAQARIRQARDQLKQQSAGALPSISANATYLHARLPGVGVAQTDGGADAGSAASSSSLDFYNAGLNASWEVDLFGKLRRGVEQSRATVGARFAALADAQVSLSAQVAQAYINLRDVQTRAELNEQTVRTEQRALDLQGRRLSGGTASLLDVEGLQARLEDAQARSFPLQAQRDEYLDQLAVLTGRTPGSLDVLLSDRGAVPLPPVEVHVGDPGSLIANRPDIREAERALAGSTAAIGVSKAKELPAIRFIGLLGLGGTSPGDIFDLSKLTVLAAPSLSWSLLDFGRARAATRQAEAQRDEAAAQYRSAVLQALEDAETSLSRFSHLRQQLAAVARADASAGRAARLNALRVEAGTSSTLDQLEVERQRFAAASALVQAKAQLTLSYVAVQKSLGLGWTASGDPAGH